MQRPADEDRAATRSRIKASFIQLGFLLGVGALVAWAFYEVSDALVTELVKLFTRDRDPGRIEGKVMSQVGMAMLGVLVGIGLGNLIWDNAVKQRRRWDSLPSSGKVTITLGLFLGLIASVPFLFFLFTFLQSNLLAFVGALILLIGGFATLSVYVLEQIADILPWNQENIRAKRSGIKILDTNVIIDGRIYDVVQSGFLEGPFYVPGFVIEELQFIADSSDSLKRQRGRRGLEVLKHMQSEFALEVATRDHLAGKPKDEVDHRLVKLALALGADIVTNDWNLNRVASLQDVQVLNMHDLALALRTNLLPAESISLAVIREGNQPFQGVGYLEDGTMVVVENGKRHIGETIDVIVTQVIQTERGKMIFASPEGESDEDLPLRRPRFPRRSES